MVVGADAARRCSAERAARANCQSARASGDTGERDGFYVHEIGAAEPVVAAGAERALNPASTIKLVTTYAGLELLGPAYTWLTEAYAVGPLNQEVLTGDLVLKGYGDPKLTLENFWLLLRELRARGLREIRGDLVLDRGYFSGIEADPGAFRRPADPALQHRAGCAARELQGGAAPVRARRGGARSAHPRGAGASRRCRS